MKFRQNPSPWYYMIDGVLINKPKPIMPGDHVHIHRWEGCYKVHRVNVQRFEIRKAGKYVLLPWSEFRCRKGQGTDERSIMKRQINLLKENLKLMGLVVSSQKITLSNMQKNQYGQARKSRG
jgi:hypothetical protein